MIQIKITIKINNYMLLYFSRERELLSKRGNISYFSIARFNFDNSELKILIFNSNS